MQQQNVGDVPECYTFPCNLHIMEKETIHHSNYGCNVCCFLPAVGAYDIFDKLSYCFVQKCERVTVSEKGVHVPLILFDIYL